MSDDKKDHLDGQDKWIPLDLASLEISEEDEAQKARKKKPDFSIFKALYDDPGIAKEDLFKRIYEIENEGENPELSHEDRFKPLLDDGNKDTDSSALAFPPGSASVPGQKPDQEDIENAGDYPEDQDPNGNLSQLVEQADKDAHDKAFEQAQKQGYDEGFNQGIEQGLEKGLEQGLNQGIEQGEKQGYEAGFEKGEVEAKALQDEKAKLLIASLETILLKTEGTWDELVKRYEGKMISLIGRIAEKVVQARVKIDKGVVRQSIIHALELLPEPEEIVLQVSEEDYEYIDMIKEDFFENIKSLTSISVVANSGITRGGCRIESATARIETDVESRLQAVFEAVLAQGEK